MPNSLSRYWLSSLIQHPAFRSMPVTPLKAYLVIRRHRDRHSGLAWPSQQRVADAIGVHRQAVTRAVRRLVDDEVLDATRKWWRGRTRLVYGFPLESERCNTGAATVGQSVATFPPDRCNTGASRVATLALRPSEVRSDGSNNSRSAAGQSAADAGCYTALCWRALVRTGLGEPTRSRLAALDGLSAEIVDRTYDNWKPTGNGTGILVRNIEAAAGAALERLQRNRQRAAERALRSATSEQRRAIFDRYRNLAGVIEAAPDSILLARNDPALIAYLNGDPAHA